MKKNEIRYIKMKKFVKSVNTKELFEKLSCSVLIIKFFR